MSGWKLRYVGFGSVDRRSKNRIRALTTVAALGFGLTPGCDAAVDPPEDSGSSSAAGDDSSTSDGSGAVTSASPVTTNNSSSTSTPPNPTPPTATAAVTTASTFGTSSSGFGSSGSSGGPDTCGNGAVDFAEQCDGKDLFGFSCEALGLGEGVLACSQACLFDTTDCVGALPDCGDGLVQPGEQCDQDNLQGLSCEALGLGGGFLACTLDCTFDTSGCMDGAGCGDGFISPGEQCDGNDLQGLSCEALGLGGGALACDPVQCVFDTSGCVP